MKKGVEQKTILSGKPMMIGASGHGRGAMALILFPLAALIALASGLADPTDCIGENAVRPAKPRRGKFRCRSAIAPGAKPANR